MNNESPNKLAWRKFRRNPFSLTGLIYIVLMFAIAVLGYLVIPDSTPYANQQHLELTTKPPGFSVKVLRVKINRIAEKEGLFHKMIFGKTPEYQSIPFEEVKIIRQVVVLEEYTGGYNNDVPFLKEYHPADVVYALNAEEEIVNLTGDTLLLHLADGSAIKTTYAQLSEEIKEDHVSVLNFPLGSDRFGRDLMSRLVIGARVSLSVGFIAVFISLVIGLTLGAIAGYFRGWIDDVITWLINVVWSIPTLLLVIAITLVLGKGFWQVFVAVGLTMWVEVARVVRGQVMGIREKEYVEAARALGYSSRRIIFRHILPNAIAPVIIISAANFASAILMEAGLSFLGIGVQPPIPSWGSMIKEHYGYIIVDMAYLAILPGLAIMLIVLSFTLVGNGLRDAWDVKSAP